MAKTDEAVALFKQGFICSQAVLSVFAQDFGLKRDIALRISQGFGAGIAYTDNLCGAVSGAIMVAIREDNCQRQSCKRKNLRASWRIS